jgi:hypothetical protein
LDREASIYYDPLVFVGPASGFAHIIRKMRFLDIGLVFVNLK